MVPKLCYLVASHGCPPGVVLPHHDRGINKAIQECPPILPRYGASHEIMTVGSLNLRTQECEEAWKPISVLSKPSQSVKIDLAAKSPLLTVVQDPHPSSMLFGSVIAEHCTRREKILQFLMSSATELEGGTVDLSLLSKLMGLQALSFDSHQKPTPLIYPGTELYAQKPLLDFVGDMVGSSRITIHPDGRVLFNGTGTEVKDLLSAVAEFYLPKNSAKWKKQSMLVPHYKRLDCSEAGVLVDRSSFKLQATVAPLKSPEKVKIKSPKKKIGRKAGREQDLYKRNYLHACESLISIMVDKRKHGKRAILSLKKSGPELPELLTQFSVGIAGTGLAVLFSVMCKFACSRVPFCSTRLFNTGLGFGLVWLSWAVNKLRDTIIYVNRNRGKLGLKEEEMMNRVDESVKEIYFRAAALMAVAVLRFA